MSSRIYYKLTNFFYTVTFSMLRTRVLLQLYYQCCVALYIFNGTDGCQNGGHVFCSKLLTAQFELDSSL